ncbi:UNVERIFIED_CONTAM: hypothetical protein Sradi_1774900 [Sesamum radiatum]|uniref:Uncharacterized protein n=1 Tax=Sesamum radiatum TaxID=300843 RepID=A0AAW2TV96_SESRA
MGVWSEEVREGTPQYGSWLREPLQSGQLVGVERWGAESDRAVVQRSSDLGRPRRGVAIFYAGKSVVGDRRGPGNACVGEDDWAERSGESHAPAPSGF